MPFKSKAQRGYLFANKPEVAKKFAKKTPKGKKLPYYVKESGVMLKDMLTSMRDELSNIVGKQKTAEWSGPIKFLPKGPERDRQLARLKREHTTRSKSTSAQKDLMDDLKFHAEEVYDKSVVGKGGIPNSRYFSALDQIGQGKLKTKADVTSYLNKTAASTNQHKANATGTMLNTSPNWGFKERGEYITGIEDGNTQTSYDVKKSVIRPTGKAFKPHKDSRVFHEIKPGKLPARKLPVDEPHQHGAAYGLVAKAPMKIKKAGAAASKKRKISKKTALYNMLYGEKPKLKASLGTNLTRVMAVVPPGNPLMFTLTNAANKADRKRHHEALKAHYAKRFRTDVKLLLGGTAATIGLGALAAKRLKKKGKTKKAWAMLAKTAFAPPISTKPIDTSVSSAGLKSGKMSPPGAGSAPSKNAGAPKGARVVVNKKGMVWDKKAPVTTRA